MAATVTPVFLGGGSTIIQWNPIFLSSQGTNFRTHSVFFSDQWRVNPRLSANLGLRYDRNDGANSAGDPVANDSAWSPRLGIVWDPTGDGDWSVTASFARYVAALNNGVANTSSAAGNPDTYQFVYRGPSINAGGVAETPTPEAVQQVFDWFFANGGPNLPVDRQPQHPRSDATDSRIAHLAERPRVRGWHQPAIRQSCRRSGRRGLSRLPRLLRLADRSNDGTW